MAAETDTPKRLGFKRPAYGIEFDADLCVGCGSCQLMCSLFHEGVGGPALSRCRLDRDPFNARFVFSICRQCLAPSCYVACPFPDQALCIDPDRGIRYIDPDHCIGCKSCIGACPLDPPAIRFNREKKKSYKCDLCRGRKEGPVCVAYCPVGALQVIKPKKKGGKQ